MPLNIGYTLDRPGAEGGWAIIQEISRMSSIGKKAKISLGAFEPDFPSFGPYEGAELALSPESLEAFSQLFKKLSASNWFCEVGDA